MHRPIAISSTRSTRRAFLRGVLGPSALLVLAACSPSSQPAAQAPTAAPAPPTAAPAPSAAPAVPSVPSPSAAAMASAVPQAMASPGPAYSGPKTKIVVSFSDRSSADLPLFLAKDAGLFDAQGLDADLQFIASATGIAALLSDQTQFALIGGPEALGGAVSGADLAVIAQLSGGQPYIMEVAKSIQSLQDLKGKRVGVSAFGSSSDTATRISLRLKGIDPENDVTIVAVGSFENRMAALASGAIDAGLATPPETLGLEDRGLHPLYDLSTLPMSPLAQTAVVKRSRINSQRDLVQRFMNALVGGCALQKKDRAKSQATLTKWLTMTDQRALDVAYDYWTGKILRVPPVVKAQEFQGFVEELAKRNDKATGYDPTKLIDNSFVEASAAQGYAG